MARKYDTTIRVSHDQREMIERIRRKMEAETGLCITGVNVVRRALNDLARQLNVLSPPKA